MAVGRRSARRQAVFVLYQQDLLKLTAGAAAGRVEGELDDYTRLLLTGVSTRREDIDTLLQKHIAGWTVDRLGILERCILRVAAYEIMWSPDIPHPVAIDEAVALARKFCSDEAGALVNGVLGSLALTAGSTRQGSDHGRD